MPKSRRKRRKPRPNGRPRRLGPTVTLLPSPSPVAAGVAQGSPTAVTAMVVPKKVRATINHQKQGEPSWYLPPDSKVRAVALNILAMRAGGKSDDDIAAELHISPKSLSPYVYRAAKNGWISADSPLDRVKYELLNKVVERLGEGLEDPTRHMTSGVRVRTRVAMEMAKGTLFKEFDQAGSAAPPSTVVAVQVVMPTGNRPTMREDTAGGTPNYADAQLVP